MVQFEAGANKRVPFLEDFSIAGACAVYWNGSIGTTVHVAYGAEWARRHLRMREKPALPMINLPFDESSARTLQVADRLLREER